MRLEDYIIQSAHKVTDALPRLVEHTEKDPLSFPEYKGKDKFEISIEYQITFKESDNIPEDLKPVPRRGDAKDYSPKTCLAEVDVSKSSIKFSLIPKL